VCQKGQYLKFDPRFVVLIQYSQKFCGIAEMTSPPYYSTDPGIWVEGKWHGFVLCPVSVGILNFRFLTHLFRYFGVQWKIKQEIGFSEFRHLYINDRKMMAVNSSFDMQELSAETGREMTRIFSQHCVADRIARRRRVSRKV